MGEGSVDIEAQRQLAAHSVEIVNMKKAQDDLVEEVRAMRATLTSIHTTLSEAKGGWKMLLFVGSAGGLLGAALNHIFHGKPLV